MVPATVVRIPRSRQAIVVLLVVVCFAALLLALDAGLRGAGLVALGVGLFVGIFVAGGRLLRPLPVANAMSQWGAFRMVRTIRLQAVERGGCEVVFELGDGSPDRFVMLHCGGVGGIKIAQLGEESLWFTALCAEELPAGQPDGMRFHLHDGENDMISLRCRSFVVTPCREASEAIS